MLASVNRSEALESAMKTLLIWHERAKSSKLAMLLQASVKAAEEAGKQAKQRAEALEKEKSALQLEAADLQRHCKDLQDRASTLTASC